MLFPKNEVLAAALGQSNVWLADVLQRPDLQLELVPQNAARSTVQAFQLLAGKGRKVHWDWEDLYFRFARKPRGWMFSMVLRGTGPGALCQGMVQDDHVSIDYLERVAGEQLQGVVAATAFQFARAVALLLDLDEVRLKDPFPELVEHYEQVLGAMGPAAVRHPADGAVKYLCVKVHA